MLEILLRRIRSKIKRLDTDNSWLSRMRDWTSPCSRWLWYLNNFLYWTNRDRYVMLSYYMYVMVGMVLFPKLISIYQGFVTMVRMKRQAWNMNMKKESESIYFFFVLIPTASSVIVTCSKRVGSVRSAFVLLYHVTFAAGRAPKTCCNNRNQNIRAMQALDFL